MDDFMNILETSYAIIIPLLGIITLILLIFILYRTYKMLIKMDEMVDEMDRKMHSFDFIFNIMDNVNGAISSVSFLKKFTKKRR